MGEWICVLDRLPEDPEEYVLCLCAVEFNREFGTTPPNGDELQAEVHSMDEHSPPFTGDYPVERGYNWRVWYWMPLPAPPGEYCND